jgi:hypothetical protein
MNKKVIIITFIGFIFAVLTACQVVSISKPDNAEDQNIKTSEKTDINSNESIFSEDENGDITKVTALPGYTQCRNSK